MSSPTEARRVASIVEAIRPLLAGHPPELQGAVLADLTAIWLAGHVGPNADKLHNELLRMHVKVIRKLIAPNQAMLLDEMTNGTRKQ